MHKFIAGAAAAAVQQHKIAWAVSPTQILQPKVLSPKNTNHCQNNNNKSHAQDWLLPVSIAADKLINAIIIDLFLYDGGWHKQSIVAL